LPGEHDVPSRRLTPRHESDNYLLQPGRGLLFTGTNIKYKKVTDKNAAKGFFQETAMREGGGALFNFV